MAVDLKIMIKKITWALYYYVLSMTEIMKSTDDAFWSRILDFVI